MRAIKHGAIHRDGARARIVCEGLNNGARVCDFLRSSGEAGVDRRDLRRMDRQHAPKARRLAALGARLQRFEVAEFGLYGLNRHDAGVHRGDVPAAGRPLRADDYTIA